MNLKYMKVSLFEISYKKKKSEMYLYTVYINTFQIIYLW